MADVGHKPMGSAAQLTADGAHPQASAGRMPDPTSAGSAGRAEGSKWDKAKRALSAVSGIFTVLTTVARFCFMCTEVDEEE